MRRVLLAVGVVGLLAAMAPPAFAATTVGQAAPSTATPTACGTSSGLVGVQTGSGPGAPSYAIPSDGVLTGYATRAASYPNAATQLVVFRHSPGHDYTVVGSSDMNHLAPSALDNFPARISVLSGDLLGIQVAHSANWCNFAGVSGDALAFSPPFDPQPGTPFTPDSAAAGHRWNIEATLEADADHDGFGDETQDQCPTVATTQGPCPVTPVKSKCKHKKKTHKSSAVIAKKCKKKHRH
jgi:hypothetical protein